MARIRKRCRLSRRESAEAQASEEFKVVRAKVIVERKKDALGTAGEWLDHQGTVWTDGSWLESRAVGVALVVNSVVTPNYVKRWLCDKAEEY